MSNITLGNLKFVKFGENKIRFWQDFSGYESIPSGISFYPERESNGSIVFIGNGYGIIQDNEFGLSGTYGSGAIYVPIENLNKGVVKYCRENFLKK